MKQLLAYFLFILMVNNLFATEFIVRDVNDSAKGSTWIALPYATSSNRMGLTTGVISVFNGFIQPHMTIVATAFVGAKMPIENIIEFGTSKETARSKGVLFLMNGYKPPFSNRMFISLRGSYAYYPNQRLYLDGSNDSTDYVEKYHFVGSSPIYTEGYNNWGNIDFRFVLPFGEGKTNITPTMKLSHGLIVNRNDKGNGLAFATGQTIFGVKYFYGERTINKIIYESSLNTNGVKLYFEHDNTDFPDNPSRGYNMKLELASDFGLMNSTQSWNAIEAEYSHYFELPNFSFSRQNVLAFNAWTAYSPSWQNDKYIGLANLNKNRPPMWEGARLGGFNSEGL